MRVREGRGEYGRGGMREGKGEGRGRGRDEGEGGWEVRGESGGRLERRDRANRIYMYDFKLQHLKLDFSKSGTALSLSNSRDLSPEIYCMTSLQHFFCLCHDNQIKWAETALPVGLSRAYLSAGLGGMPRSPVLSIRLISSTFRCTASGQGGGGGGGRSQNQYQLSLTHT